MSSADRDKTSYISYYSSDDLVLSLNIQRLCLWCLWKEMMFSSHFLSHLILLMTIKIQESRMSFSAGDPHFRLSKTEQTWQVLHLGTTVGEVPPPSLASKSAKSRSFRDFDSTLLSFSGLIDSYVPRMHCISYQITSVLYVKSFKSFVMHVTSLSHEFLLIFAKFSNTMKELGASRACWACWERGVSKASGKRNFSSGLTREFVQIRRLFSRDSNSSPN